MDSSLVTLGKSGTWITANRKNVTMLLNDVDCAVKNQRDFTVCIKDSKKYDEKNILFINSFQTALILFLIQQRKSLFDYKYV
jgi:hypothetical protein